MDRSERIWLSSPTMHDEEQQFIKDAFEKNWITCLGENCDGLEKDITKYVNIGYGTVLVSGTAAIHMAVKLAGVSEGDVVLCSDMTFSATVNPVVYEKGIPVFIDSEPETWNMDPEALEKAFNKYNGRENPKPKAVIVANLYGTPAKLNQIREICDKHNTIMIEDAAESLSATYQGKQTGTFGHYNIFSFNGNKIITTSGGGMLVSDDEEAIKKVKFWATQARDPQPWYQHSELGYNYRMSNILAGIGRGQMLHLEEHKKSKQEIYHIYKQGLKDLPLILNPYTKDSDPNFWLTCIMLHDNCKVKPYEIMERLSEENIESRPIWKPMHMQPYYINRDFITINKEPYNEKVFQKGLCLPSDIKMNKLVQDEVILIIRSLFR